MSVDKPLVINNLHKRYGATSVLSGINLYVESGSIYGLVGLNGAGKSTTLACALGLQGFNQGDIQLFGVPANLLHQLGGKVAVVFDEPSLLPHLTVLQQMQWANKITCAGTTRENLHLITQRLGLTRYHHYKALQLSLGNRRRLSIATALVGDPKLVILDEPFNGLDAGGVESLLDIIVALQQQGITFLLASHQLSYLERICTHLAILHQGKIALADRLDNLLHDQTSSVQLVVSDNAISVLENIPGVKLVATADISACTGGIKLRLHCELSGITTAALNRALVSANVDVHELTQTRQTLTDLFKSITEPSDVVLSA